MTARRQRIGAMDQLRERNNTRLFATKQKRDADHGAFMGSIKNVVAQSLDEIANDMGDARRGSVQVRSDGAAAVARLNRILYFSTNATPVIELPSNALTESNILEVILTGSLVQNTGSNQTITPRFYIGKASSETLVTSETSLTVASSTARKTFKYSLRISSAPWLGLDLQCDEEFIVESTIVGTPQIISRTTYTTIIDITALSEINSAFIRIANGATATMFKIYTNTISVQVLDAVGMGEIHWWSNASVDNSMSQLLPTTNYGTVDDLWVGEQISASEIKRGLIKCTNLVNIKSAYPNVQIKEAYLFLTLKQDLSNNARTLQAFRLLKDWGETTSNWNTTDGTTAWSTAGAGNSTLDYDGSVVFGSQSFGAAETILTVKSIPLDVNEFQKWVDGENPNYGLLLKMQTESDDAWGMYSRNSGFQDLRPIWYVVFTVPN